MGLSSVHHMFTCTVNTVSNEHLVFGLYFFRIWCSLDMGRVVHRWQLHIVSLSPASHSTPHGG